MHKEGLAERSGKKVARESADTYRGGKQKQKRGNSYGKRRKSRKESRPTTSTKGKRNLWPRFADGNRKKKKDP